MPLRVQVEHGDLRSAEEAESGREHTKAAVGVQKHVPDAVDPDRILASVLWEHRRAHQRKPDLAAMREPGKLRVEAAARRGGIGEVRLVHEQYGCAGSRQPSEHAVQTG